MKRESIITPRLRLAMIRPQDRAELTALMTDSEVTRTYMVPDLDTQKKKDALFMRFLTLSRTEDRFVYGIYLEDTLIGVINEVGKREGWIELGYVISPAEKNKGYATEALKAAISALFAMGYGTVKTGAFAENAASRRVMEKSGMTLTDETENIEYRGESHLCVYYTITNGKGEEKDHAEN